MLGSRLATARERSEEPLGVHGRRVEAVAVADTVEATDAAIIDISGRAEEEDDDNDDEDGGGDLSGDTKEDEADDDDDEEEAVITGEKAERRMASTMDSSSLHVTPVRPLRGCEHLTSTAPVAGWRHTTAGRRPLLRYSADALSASSVMTRGTMI